MPRFRVRFSNELCTPVKSLTIEKLQVMCSIKTSFSHALTIDDKTLVISTFLALPKAVAQVMSSETPKVYA